MTRVGLLVAVVTAGCTGTVTDDDTNQCTDPAPPAGPIVRLTPAPDGFVVVPEQLAIEVSPYADANGDQFLQLEVEIWKGDELAWRAVSADPAVHTFTLASGVLSGSAAVLGTLEGWTDHIVRARYQAQIADGCISDGPWTRQAFRTDDGSAAIYDTEVVREYRVDLPDASYAAINAEAIPPGCVPYLRNYYDATLRYEDLTFPNVGAKAKGGCGSARDLSGKTSLKLNLSWDSPDLAGCPDERRLDGLQKLTFNNMVQDPSMSHELLAYAFYREMGVAVPRAALMKLYINDQYFGVYLNIETIDRRFLARHFVSNRGMLYEGTYWCDLFEANVHDDDSGCLTREFIPDACSAIPEPGDDPQDFTPLHQLIASIDALPPGGFYPAITGLIDMDALFSMWAVESVLAHWDGYVFEIVNNYRIYHDPGTGLWTIIPTGTDQTFQRPDFNPWAVTGRIAQQCLAEPACEAAFAARLRVAVGVFAGMNMTTRRQHWGSIVGGLVVPDPGREFSQGAFDQVHAETQSFIDVRPGIVDQMLIQHGF